MPPTNDIYSTVTDRIIQQIEDGTPPWRRPWTEDVFNMPCNIVSGKPYKGINVLLLWDAADQQDFTSNLWGTYRQWQTMGGQVKRGERATTITYFKTWGRRKKRFILREHNIFALEQVEGNSLERFRQATRPKRDTIDFQPAEDVIAATGADIHHGGDKAFYLAEHDLIVLPFKMCFDREEEYWSTASHELSHWSGHPDRLDRIDKLAQFGSNGYAIEELIAEMSAAFLTASLGIPNTGWENQHASYLKTWLDVLKSDSRAIVKAASQASRAADYILSFSQGVRREDKTAAIV